MNKKLTQLNHILIGILLISQLFIAMFQANIARDVQLFGLSVFEVFNIVLSLICFGITVFVHSEKRIFIKYIPYEVVLGIYLILHIYNTYQFDQTVYAAQTPSFLTEAYYIFRMFVVPMLLLFNIYYSGMQKEQLIKMLEIFVFIVVVIMFATNLLHVALQNYSEEPIYAKLSFFDWFTFENSWRYDYYRLTTKGWFLSGNQMAGILFMTFPVIVYRAYQKRSWFHYVTVGLQMMSMFMLGNKVSNLGCLLIVAIFGCLWALFKALKHKEQGIIKIMIIGICFLILFPISPVGYMIRYQNVMKQNGILENQKTLLEQAMEAEITEEMDAKEKAHIEKLKKDSLYFLKLDANNLTEEQQAFIVKYIDEYHLFFGISPYITTSYDSLESASFWNRYMKEAKNNDYRAIKSAILEDIYQRNQNSMDKYLGMGHTLNYIYTEADYSYQLYSYGIVGFVLLIGPYFYILLYVLVQGLKNFKNMFTLESAMYFLAPVLGLGVAKFSGHIFENTMPLMVIGVVGGILLLHTRNQVAGSRKEENGR